MKADKSFLAKLPLFDVFVRGQQYRAGFGIGKEAVGGQVQIAVLRRLVANSARGGSFFTQRAHRTLRKALTEQLADGFDFGSGCRQGRPVNAMLGSDQS